ncbi:MAG: T9SS type A sorting domain-containing protein [Prevotellaceae bacterium]|nr:T9SS type A sorting domain-containing protein [Prevotellaceae bacterium]
MGFALPLALALLLAAQSVKAEGLYNQGSLNGVTITTGGYMEVDVPVYDCDYDDEAVYRGILYLKVDNTEHELFQWDSQTKYDDWQDDDGYHSHWARFRRHGTHTAAVLVNGQPIGNTSGWSAKVYTANHESGSVTHRVTVYLSATLLQNYMGRSVHLHTSVEIDENNDRKDGKIWGDKQADKTMPSWANPTISSIDFSSEAGKYAATWSVLNAPEGSEYRWGESGDYLKSTSGATDKFDVADTQQSRTLNFWYKISSYQRITTSATGMFPAYQQPLSFSATNADNGNTTLTWKIGGTQPNQQTGDAFEVQRSTDAGFSTFVTVGTLDYSPAKGTYTLTDPTGEDNLNCPVYYRIRRTKATGWNWSFCKATEIVKSMSHVGVVAGSVRAGIDDDNMATVTWQFNSGNVTSSNSQIVIERVNLVTQQRDKISLPYAKSTTSYEEELTAMCQEFMYNVHVVPGNAKYPAQDPVASQLSDPDRRIIPLRLGNVPAISASKGYFSDRVELEWELADGAVETFAITRRQYGATDDFKQIDTKASYEASKIYTYSDATGIPGQLYEYRITGLTSCADGVHETYSPPAVGFRTPTGDIYGRVTFESGQAVENVEINVVTEESIRSRSLAFADGATASVSSKEFLKNNTAAVTLQAWIAPEATGGLQKIISKNGLYELGIDANKFYFKAGNATAKADAPLVSAVQAGGRFMHLTGVYDSAKLLIYVNGKLVKEAATSGVITGNNNPVQLGGGAFAGIIDEVRIWGSALSAGDVERDYNRYLTGGESGLLAYYTFNYAVATEFYDISFAGTSYNENHGVLATGVSLSEDVPTADQLGYRGITAADGSYSVRSVPYQGNGTAYRIIPRLGIHAFESEQEVRFIGSGAQSHTVNFTDKSSFRVTGWITYENSTIPVEGVNFAIDGRTVVKSNGIPEASGTDGSFEIQVPVGTHEVKATKANHTFVDDGRITNPYGLDLNYQDEVLGVELKDNTTIKFIGRVAGGTIQEEYPLGHSVSKNNLADGITVTLTHIKTETLIFKDTTITEAHFKPSNRQTAYANKVEYKENQMIIHVNDTTGEFVANVIPEQFTVRVNAGSKHVDVPGSGGMINLTQQFGNLSTVYEYTDSVKIDGDQWQKTNYSDTVYYNFARKFIKRYAPIARVAQLNSGGEPVSWFGSDSIVVANILGEETTVHLVDKATGAYALGKPVFVQHSPYRFRLNIFEQYVHYRGDEALDTDEVPTQDAKIQLNNDIADNDNRAIELPVDSTGTAIYPFRGGDIELTTAVKRISVKFVYGGADNPTSIDWNYPASFGNGEAYVLGSHQTGVDFTTAGPDKVLTVLRDPPGSKSYSFLEKGTSFSSSDTYTGKLHNEGSETWKVGISLQLITFTGVGAGVINKTLDQENGTSIGVEHEEEYEGQDSRKMTTTTTTRFQTSDDPLYVGADGDLFIGNSTNFTFGTTENITIVPREHYDEAPDAVAKVYDDAHSEYVLVLTSGRSASLSFGTLFAYPQIHIEQRLIPQLEEIRNGLLLETQGYTIEALQAAADADESKVFYYSYFDPESPHFGKSNEDESIKNISNGIAGDLFDGPSYKIIRNANKNVADSIHGLNLSINNWIARLYDNEKAKKEAKLKQNYSFHAGSKIEYSESYAQQVSHTSTFSIQVGLKVGSGFYINAAATTTKFEFEEHVNTTHGGTFSTEAERSHSKGFVLEDDGDDDYLTVDVMTEKNADDSYSVGGGTVSGGGGEVDLGNIDEKTYYPSFIFRTLGGATSCPYEGAYYTKYFEPGSHKLSEATKRIEVPFIDMETKFVENVPSGETAKLRLYLRNNSEIQEDVWYDLKVLDGSNPDGARFSIDGTGIGNGRAFLVPAGETLVKTLEVGKGAVLNYDDLQLILQSQCQYDPTNFLEDIADTVTFTVHFIPSCTDVNIRKPSNSWTYNTRLPLMKVGDADKHYMEVLIDGFNVNYDNFGRIELQYKSASQSDDEWIALMSYYTDSAAYNAAIENGLNAEMILASYAGTIPYRFVMDDLPDQRYDLRAASVCIINNEEIRNESEIRSGIKDMYLPRLFGSPQPADGILNVEDDVRLNFNEAIAEGLLTRNNFTVQGVRNGSITDHSTSIELDGENDYLETEFEKSFEGKDVTVEMWIQAAQPQNATLFSHGNINESLELAVTADNKLRVTVGSSTVTSPDPVAYDQGSWAHVALVYEAGGFLTAYYNYSAVISRVQTGEYSGIGNVLIGKSIKADGNPYAGKVHNVRIWEKPVASADLQVNSLAQLSGIETGLVAYYPMNEGKGSLTSDKARGATLLMNGGRWALPDGFAVATSGTDYLQIDASTAAITNDMDFTIEFWFKGEPNQTGATLLSSGRGDGLEAGGSDYLFNIGFDENGALAFTSKGVKTAVAGSYLDNTWHHFAIGVDRAIGRGQIYMDGKLNTYIDASNIGGVRSAYLYLGARGWYAPENAADLIVDSYFKGQFDDLRFWQLYKNERLVSENSNVKLSGKELGLLHYYPFDTYIEHQGIKYLEFTNKDMRIAGGANPETDKLAVVGATEAEIQSKDIAPLKDAGPLADLEFDFVVNNDALIINLKEQEYKVSKTIVTFTVDDVRDKNGNAIASPITWSAYIDRNQLKWSEDRLNLTKKAYDGLEFTVRAINSGGLVQRYTIGNIPAWLEVAPSEGTLNPSSYEEIRFSVNEGLNIGAYSEVVYLTGEDRVSEALTLNLTVTGEQPEWTVNPADFKYNMSVFGKMRFNNIFSTDTEDILATFDNGVCVGVAKSVYNKTVDMWYTFLTIYGNSLKSDNLEFRMWDASTGKTYKAAPDTNIPFVNDTIIGDVEKPVIFDGGEIFYQNIALQKAWSWISFNLASSDLGDVNKTLANGKWTSRDIVKSKEYFDSYSANSKKWTGSLSNHNGFNNTSMFMLYASQEQAVSVSGTVIDTKTTPIAVNGKQWSYIGYLPSVNTTVKEGLAGYAAQKGDVIKSQNRFAMFSQNEWIGDLIYLEANKGYMLYRTAADNVTFTYPSVSGALSNLWPSAVSHSSALIRAVVGGSGGGGDGKYFNSNFSENMSIIAAVDGLQAGDRILAYINGELRGAGEYALHEEKPLTFITVAGNEAGAAIRFEWQRGSETLGEASAPFAYQANSVIGTIENPVRLNFGVDGSKPNFGIGGSKVAVYPNPFRADFRISLEAKKDSPIEVTVVDVTGRVVWLKTETAPFDGPETIVVDGASFKVGVYIVKVKIGSYEAAYITEKITN